MTRSRPAHPAGSRRRVWLGAMLSAGLVLTVLPAATSAAPPLVRFRADYNDCVVSGIGPASTTIKITWKDRDGSLKHVQTVKSKASGSFKTTCDYDEQVERGDLFIARIGSKSRTFTVPRLGYRIDRVEDRIWGKAPDATAVRVIVPGFSYDPTVSGGEFTVDTSGDVDLLGSAWVTVFYETPAGDIVQREQQVPYLSIPRGRADVFMVGNPGRLTEVELWDASMVALQSSVHCALGPTGECWLRFTDEDGHLVHTQTGDRVRATSIGSDADWAIPPVTVSGIVSTDVLKGTCLAGSSSPYWVEAYRASGSGYVSRSGMTSAAGTFSKDVTSNYDLRSGDKVYLGCRLWTGDWVSRFITVP